MDLEKLLRKYDAQAQLELAELIYEYLCYKYDTRTTPFGKIYLIRFSKRNEMRDTATILMKPPWNIPYKLLKDMSRDVDLWMEDLEIMFNSNPNS